ncbi:protein-disulfide reductase DsbD family protein [Microbulbifer epialgicus]|uniref:Protein-disulfide reductase DsbD family protein n=1 Tax=Microbulbifer epialgicus TaxID=393907 RepID=A0ABV4P389_9GAMM
MIVIRWFLLFILCFSVLPGKAHLSAQETASGDHVTVRWLAPASFAEGKTEKIGFYFEVDPDWHVYWRNPGDSGAAPRFTIRPAGASVGPIEWPFPVRLRIEHLTNLGYAGNVAYLFDLTPDPGVKTVSLQVDLEWLVCKIECIPGFATMTLSRPVGDKTRWQSGDQNLRNHFAQRIPRPSTSSPWEPVALAALGEDRIRLLLEGEKGRKPPQVFPLDGNLFSAAKPALQREGKTLIYIFERLPGAALRQSADFVLSDGSRAWQLDEVSFSAALPQAQQRPLWLLVLAALAGGIILNLMPCVFPVLSIKLLGLVREGHSDRGRLLEGLLYATGVLTTFTALGALLLVLRAGGAAIGWGFQLQSAPVVMALLLLFWLVALSFSGAFEFGHRLMNLAGVSRGGSFATGVLAVFVAAPCTGPFMGAALGTAAILPATEGILIFLGLGVGLAVPFVVLCASPALLNRLPAPGPWMEKLRQLLAFPLYATVIWLLWVLGRMLGESGWLIGALLLLAVTFALWLGRNFSRVGRACAWVLLLVSLGIGYLALVEGHEEAPQAVDSWQKYDPRLLEQALGDHRPVFIDYTAAWCITCQVNKKLVLDTPEVQKLFRDNNVLLLRADWTRQDPEITEALALLGRNSVPVYAWYPAGATEPELLPQILQKHMISDLFAENNNTQNEKEN